RASATTRRSPPTSVRWWLTRTCPARASTSTPCGAARAAGGFESREDLNHRVVTWRARSAAPLSRCREPGGRAHADQGEEELGAAGIGGHTRACVLQQRPPPLPRRRRRSRSVDRGA